MPLNYSIFAEQLFLFVEYNYALKRSTCEAAFVIHLYPFTLWHIRYISEVFPNLISETDEFCANKIYTAIQQLIRKANVYPITNFYLPLEIEKGRKLKLEHHPRIDDTEWPQEWRVFSSCRKGQGRVHDLFSSPTL